MKKIIILLTMAVLICQGFLYSQKKDINSDNSEQQRKKDQRPERRESRFSAMDVDNNGFVTITEFMDHEKEKFSKMDIDRDGTVSEKEMQMDEARKNSENEQKGRKDDKFTKLDVNKDSSISLDEYLSDEKKKFLEMDTDKDNKLTQIEMQDKRERRTKPLNNAKKNTGKERYNEK